MTTSIHFWSYLAQFFLEWEMFQTKYLEKKHKFYVNNILISKIVTLRDKVEKIL